MVKRRLRTRSSNAIKRPRLSEQPEDDPAMEDEKDEIQPLTPPRSHSSQEEPPLSYKEEQDVEADEDRIMPLNPPQNGYNAEQEHKEEEQQQQDQQEHLEEEKEEEHFSPVVSDSESPRPRRRSKRFLAKSGNDVPSGQNSPSFQDDNPNGDTGPPFQPEYSDDEIEVEREDPGEDEDDEDDKDDGYSRVSKSHGFSVAGILRSIRMDRFMCHRCFQFDLSQNVNFISGENGAGKSAACVALQIGLGARPGQTERGKKAEDFIMRGESSGVITIKIFNQIADNGPNMSFKHDLYGDFITVERKLFRGKTGSAGSSTWSIKGKKNAKNFKLPRNQTARKEIMELVDHYGYNVLNPVAILTQEKSKAFLAKGKPKQHYQLYMEATLLAPLERELAATEDITAQVNKFVSFTESKQPDADRQLEKLQIAHNEAQEMKHLGTRFRDASRRLAWTEYEEARETANNADQHAVDKLHPKLMDLNRKHDKLESSAQAASEKLQELVSNVEESNARSQNAGRAFAKAKQDSLQCTNDLNRLKSSIQSCEANITDMDRSVEQSNVEKEQARAKHFQGQSQKERVVSELNKCSAEVTSCEKELDSCGSKKSAIENERLPLPERIQQCQHDHSRASQMFDDKMSQKARVEAQLRQRGGAHDLTKYGEYVPRVLDQIARNRNMFEVEPIGPLGKFIKVEDETWVPVIEEHLGRNTLTAFFVDNARDQRALYSFFKAGEYRPQVLVVDMKAPRYELNEDSMPAVQRPEYKTMLECLNISNDTVFNGLLDFSQIETTVLCENNDHRAITSLSRSRTRNVGVVWNKQGCRAFVRGGANVFRNGSNRMAARYLTKDMKPYLDSLAEEVKNADTHKTEIERALNNLRRQDHQLMTQLNAVNRDISQLRVAKRRADERKTSLENQLNRAAIAFDESPFDKVVEEYLGRKNEYIGQKKRYEEDITKRQEQASESKDAMTNAKRELSAARKEQESAAKHLENCQESVGKERSLLRNLKKLIASAEADLAAHNRNVENFKRAAQAKLEAAKGFGECPENIDIENEPSSKISREVAMCQKRLETEQNRRGGKSAEEIEKDFIVARGSHRKNLEKLRRVKDYHNALKSGISRREKHLKKLSRTLKKIVRSSFRDFLGTRRHDGDIRFTADQELLISTKMASHVKGDGEMHETKDLRSLSGGERSFTTLCFMMALAEICNVPVRVMDEIDVYQDETNRRASYKMLVDLFKNYLSHRQIILITPHRLPGIRESNYVKTFYLEKDGGDGNHRQTQIDSFLE